MNGVPLAFEQRENQPDARRTMATAIVVGSQPSRKRAGDSSRPYRPKSNLPDCGAGLGIEIAAKQIHESCSWS
jgi:hypothetical protein